MLGGIFFKFLYNDKVFRKIIHMVSSCRIHDDATGVRKEGILTKYRLFYCANYYDYLPDNKAY